MRLPKDWKCEASGFGFLMLALISALLIIIFPQTEFGLIFVFLFVIGTFGWLTINSLLDVEKSDSENWKTPMPEDTEP